MPGSRSIRAVIDRRVPTARIGAALAAAVVAVAAIVDRWIDGCAKVGYRAIEPDDLDASTRSPKLLSESDALAYARLLADHAHATGLAIAQKHAPDLGTEGKRAGFDFAVAEECQRYDECGECTAVYGRHVLEVEDTDTPRRAFTTACRERGDPDLGPAAGPRRRAARECRISLGMVLNSRVLHEFDCRMHFLQTTKGDCVLFAIRGSIAI